MQAFSVSAPSRANRDRVWALVADTSSWAEWGL
jgi:hypothetical protein